MKRALFIFLSLALAFVGWNMVCAEDFYVIPAMRGKYAPVPKTGQTLSYATGDDGDLEKGVAWPTPRFTDNGVTVTDNLTGLIWTKNANGFGLRTWYQALTDAKNLGGDWRLPNLRELQSLIDYSRNGPALPEGHPFVAVQSSPYWSSTTCAFDTTIAWRVYFFGGHVAENDKSGSAYVWCVRGGK